MSDPIIKMDAEGKASIISYNVPEPTAYSGRNIIELEFEESWFTEEAKSIPENRKQQPSDDELESALESAKDLNVINPSIFPNISVRSTSSGKKINRGGR